MCVCVRARARVCVHACMYVRACLRVCVVYAILCMGTCMIASSLVPRPTSTRHFIWAEKWVWGLSAKSLAFDCVISRVFRMTKMKSQQFLFSAQKGTVPHCWFPSPQHQCFIITNKHAQWLCNNRPGSGTIVANQHTDQQKPQRNRSSIVF